MRKDLSIGGTSRLNIVSLTSIIVFRWCLVTLNNSDSEIWTERMDLGWCSVYIWLYDCKRYEGVRICNER